MQVMLEIHIKFAAASMDTRKSDKVDVIVQATMAMIP
jgi:hypothetical protein